MNLKVVTLLSGFLLVGCQSGYMADHSLKQTWSQDLEDSQPSQIPYALIYRMGSKRLIYVAAASDRRAQSNAIIESLIERDKPKVVLVQGHEEGKIVHPSKVSFYLRNHRPTLKGASASREDILNQLSGYGLTERDYVIFETLTKANQQWQFEVDSRQALTKRINHYLQTNRHAKKHKLTYSDVKTWFLDNVGTPLTFDILTDGELIAPMDPKLQTTTLLQKMSTYEDEIDDETVMDTLSDELDENSVVMIIRAPSKYVTEQKVLHNMLGVNRPSEIVN